MTEPTPARPVPGPPRPGPGPVPTGEPGPPREGGTTPPTFEDLDERPVAEHVALFEAEHSRLQNELGTIDQL